MKRSFAKAFMRRCSTSFNRVVDLKKYPIHELNSTQGKELLEKAWAQMDKQGYTKLPGFIHKEVADIMTKEALDMEPLGVGFTSTESHNLFLEDPSDDSPPICFKHFQSSKTLIAADIFPKTSEAWTLYNNPHILEFCKAALRLDELHPSGDELNKFYYNIFNVDDQLGWHFDRSQFSINIILQPSEAGGFFEYIPDTKELFSELKEWPEEDPTLSRYSPIAEDLQPGDLYLFHGNRSVHRVSPVEKGKRVNLIVTFNTKPGEKLNSYTLKKFFGREGS